MSIPTHFSIAVLLKRAGLPEFPLDEYGFPQPGAVVRYFREQMKYIDPEDHKEKCWRQVDLAERLGVSEITVRLMETKNNGLGFERRRLLADILKIPPILLGIGSLADLEEFLKQYEAAPGTTISAPATLKRTHVEKETIQLYQDAFSIYNEKHATSTAHHALFGMGQWIGRITSDLDRANIQQQRDLQRLLWDFHVLSARVYSDGLCDWDNAFAHLDAAIEQANLLNSDDLRALSLYRSGQIRLEQWNFQLAKVDLDAALGYAKKGHPSLKRAILASAGLIHALVDKDEAGKAYARSLIEEAGDYFSGEEPPDEYALRYNLGKYLTVKADALITLGRPGKALEVLDDAEIEANRLETRRVAHIDILRAEANIKLKRPQYDTATQLLMGAFGVSSNIKSEYNIGYISRLYTLLAKSSYGNSTQVSDLGIALRNWSRRN